MNTKTTLDRIEKDLLDLWHSGCLSESVAALVHVAWASVINAKALDEDLDHRGTTYLEYLKSLKPTVYPTTHDEA